MGSLENGLSLKRERDQPLLRSPSATIRSEKQKPRSNRLARFVLFGKIDYLQWVCAVGVFFFFIVLFQMMLPGSVVDNSKGEVMTWQMIGELDFGEDIEFEPRRVLTKFKKNFTERGVRFGSRKPLIALVFADLFIDPQQIQMVTVAIALKEIGYEIEVLALENGVAGDVWRKVGVPVTTLKTVEKNEVVVDWLRYDGIIVNSIEAREAFSRLLQEPFKSVPVIWSINDRTLFMHLRQYQSDGQFDLVNDWQKFFNRSSVVVFPNYALPMYYTRYDSGNFFVVPGSPAEAWEANNFMVSHQDNTSVKMNDDPNNFVIVVVGSQFMYKGLWLEHALVLKALLPLLQEFSPDHDLISRLKIIILSGDSTGNYSMAVEAVASNLKFPKDTIRHAAADEDKNSILSMSNLVIYGSCLEELSFPSILVKAMSYGKPIIAPNLAMITKYVDDRVNGYLFPKEDIKALTQILKLAISEGNLSPSAYAIASNGKESARNLMVSETVEGYAYLLENVLKLPSEVELSKPVTEIPSNLKEEWQWKLFESISDPVYPISKAHKFLRKIEKQWNRSQTENSVALSTRDETFFYSIWEEEKSIQVMNAKKRREEDQLKDRTDQTRGTWEEVYRNAKKADRSKNILHERDDGELERTGQPLTIYEPYLGEGTWPFLHRSSLYRGLGLSTKGRRPRTDDIDAASRISLLDNTYYRDALGEFGGFFALANRVDRVHKNAWIGFHSWRATARKESLSKAAETAILESIQSRRHGDTLYFWSRMDTDPRNPLKQDFWSFCDAINTGNCKITYSEVMKKMYGIKDGQFSLPPMPVGEDTWSVMHSWALPTKSFLEFVMFSRMFVDVLDAQFYEEHHRTGHCRLSLSKDKHCYSRVLEMLVNVWAYHSARKMVYVNPETGAMQEQHKLRGRKGKMWVKWFSFPLLKSMDEDLAEEFDSEKPQRHWLWPNTGEVFWQGMYERERRMRNKEKAVKKQERIAKLDRMSKRHGQKPIGKYIKPSHEEAVVVDGGLNTTVAKVLR